MTVHLGLCSFSYTFEEPRQDADTSSESDSDDGRPPAAKRVAAQKSPVKKLVVAPKTNTSDKKQKDSISGDTGGHDGSTDEMSDQDVASVPKPQIKPDVPESKPKVKTQSKATKTGRSMTLYYVF